ISFVFTIGASPGLGRGDRRVVDREVFGYNLSLPEDQQRLFGDAQLSVSLKYGSFGVSQDQIQNYAFHRAAALQLAEQWHIPSATTTEVTDEIKKLRMFMTQDGQFDAKAYQTFKDSLKSGSRGGASEGDILRVIGDDVRAEKVNKLLAGPGYVLPADVKQELNRYDTTWTISTANVDYKSMTADIKPTDAELTKWFEESGGRYDIQPRVSVSYVEFPAANYVPEVKVTDADVRAFYDANPTRFPKPADSAKPADATPKVTPPADPAADFAAVRGQVETALKQERARQRAARAASDLTLALYEGKVASTAVDSFLATRKLTAKPLAPFARDTGAAELGGAPEITAEAFKLGKERFASEAIPTPNGAVVLFWKDTLPTRKPLFTEVRDKVAADYVESEKRKRFVELGRTLKGQIETRLKAGDAFDKAVAAASSGGVKLEAKSIPAFSLRNPPRDIEYPVMMSLDRLSRGQVSDMLMTGDQGVFVYVADKKTPDANDSNPAYAEAKSQLARATSQVAGSSVLAEIVEKELKRTMPKAE
ncbi:MAG TPA: peptidyl-prolyl cis-trans isomerase, partial [Opitutaceae bacterium]|nr:peptidyl-prolyl cis-trans isomerase [Opitutaceae bacterium]